MSAARTSRCGSTTGPRGIGDRGEVGMHRRTLENVFMGVAVVTILVAVALLLPFALRVLSTE